MNPYNQDSTPAKECQRRDSDVNRHRSKTIPLPSSHIARTQSELQLSEDMAAAEWKDLCMFYRVVGGIREQQQQQQCSHGAPIAAQKSLHTTTIQERQSKPVRDWTGKDVTSTVDPTARVTPFESTEHVPSATSTTSPRDTFIPYPQSLLLKSPRRSNDSGWSITGFEDDDQGGGTSLSQPLALIGQDSSELEDEAVFVMDL